MGPRAKAAFPLLVSELTNKNPQSRIFITNALRQIDPEAAAKVLGDGKEGKK